MFKILVVITALFSLSIAPAFADPISATATNTAGAQAVVNGVNPVATSGSQAVINGGLSPSAKIDNVSAGVGNVGASVEINSAPARYQDFPNTVQPQQVNLGLGGYAGPYGKDWTVVTMPWTYKDIFTEKDFLRFLATNGYPKGKAEVTILADVPGKLSKSGFVTIVEPMKLPDIKKSFEIIATIDVHTDDETNISLSHLYFKAFEENLKNIGGSHMMVFPGSIQGSEVFGYNIGASINTSVLEKANPASIGSSGAFGFGFGEITGKPRTFGSLSAMILKPKNASTK